MWYLLCDKNFPVEWPDPSQPKLEFRFFWILNRNVQIVKSLLIFSKLRIKWLDAFCCTNLELDTCKQNWKHNCLNFDCVPFEIKSTIWMNFMNLTSMVLILGHHVVYFSVYLHVDIPINYDVKNSCPLRGRSHRWNMQIKLFNL